jgi:hypothetical protein
MIFYNIKLHQNIIDEHFTNLKSYLENKIDNSTINREIKEFIETNLEEIIKGEPHALKRIDSELKVLPNFSNTKIIKNKIAKIFNYKYFIDKDSPYSAYDLAKKLNIRTCLYCNRNYTLTIMRSSRREDKLTRPEFDHFFDKGQNPLFSLSIQNLIPSCKICNSTLKGRKKFKLSENIHPYLEDVINNFKYKFVPHDVTSILGRSANLEVTIEIFTTDRNLVRKITNSTQIFKLEHIMSAHSDELQDLFEIRHKYSERYLIELFESYERLGLNLKDVYRTAFGTYYEEADFGMRPFSKLKKDILKELQIVT